MTTTQRRLLLHAGVGKTGSSALQTAFVLNRDLLRSSGVHYPTHPKDEIARRGGVTSGNGARLRPWLVPRGDGGRPRVRRLKARLLDELDTPGTHTLLYSSEFLYLARPERLEELRSLLARHHATLEVVVYLRTIVDHALSSYSQVVKRSLFSGTFTDYLDPATEGHYHLPLDRLLAMPALLGAENVTALHYDSVRHELVGRFFRDVLGIDRVPEDPGTTSVNRALTPAELDLMRRVNPLLADKAQARRVSDAVLERSPLGPPGFPPVTDADMELLRRRFADQVDQVNEELLGEDTLSIGQPPTSAPPARAPEASEREQVLLGIIARLADDRS